MSVVKTKILSAPPKNEREILRYAGSAGASSEDILSLVSDCLAEVQRFAEYKVCYAELPISISDDVCDLGALSVRSSHLAKNLASSESVILFAATVGVGIDRLIAKYSSLSPARALILDAIGAERIESLCDAFCKEYEKEHGVKLAPRFSAGYGDLPLEAQKEIFSLLAPQKNIGLFLNSSLSMSPSKSVTAIIGIKNGD